MLPHQYRSLNGRKGTSDGIPIDYDQNQAALALYDLSKDIEEKVDLKEVDTIIFEQMLQLAEKCRQDMGDALTETTGKNLRQPGFTKE